MGIIFSSRLTQIKADIFLNLIVYQSIIKWLSKQLSIMAGFEVQILMFKDRVWPQHQSPHIGNRYFPPCQADFYTILLLIGKPLRFKKCRPLFELGERKIYSSDLLYIFMERRSQYKQILVCHMIQTEKSGKSAFNFVQICNRTIIFKSDLQLLSGQYFYWFVEIEKSPKFDQILWFSPFWRMIYIL